VAVPVITAPILACPHLLAVLCALSQFGKSAAGEAAELGRSGIELLGMIGVAGLECGEPAAETGEFIRRQLGNGFGDFFDFHAVKYSAFWLGREHSGEIMDALEVPFCRDDSPLLR
jgi:hypothetical protein